MRMGRTVPKDHGRSGRTKTGRGGHVGGGSGTIPAFIAITSTTIAEDAALTDVIGTLSVVNLGALTVSSYSITADPDSKFDISSDDLIVDGALDYETATSHSVTVRATLSDASTVDRTFAITVTDVADELVTPVLTWDGEYWDALPDFDLALVAPQVDDDATLEWSTSSTKNPDGSYVTQTGTATVTVTAGPTLPPFTISALPNGTYYFHAKHIRGAVESDWSDDEVVTINVNYMFFGQNYFGPRYFGQRYFG